jgi:hypothetical protein
VAEKKKDRGSTPERPEPAPGPETAEVAFDDIIDAILDADPEAVRRQRKGTNRKSKPHSTTNK